MAVGTSIAIKQGEQQFRGVFSYVWVVTFTLDTPSVSGNSSNQDTIVVPGLRLATDVVIGATNTSGPLSTMNQDIHVGADNELHVVSHNASGNPIDPASAVFRVIVARVQG